MFIFKIIKSIFFTGKDINVNFFNKNKKKSLIFRFKKKYHSVIYFQIYPNFKKIKNHTNLIKRTNLTYI